MLNVNQVLQKGRYRIIDEIAQNRSGGGYKAYDTVLETNVVLKETRVDRENGSAQPDGLRSAFSNEVKNLTGLKHESLAQVHNYFAEVDREYLVAEHIDGDFLSDLFENGSDAFPVAKAAAVADKLLDALDYLHTRVPPIIHRGIKPQEIKLSADGNVKLFIFGIAENSGANSRIAFSNPAFAAPNLRYLSFEQIWEGLDATSQKVIGNSYDDESSQQILEQPADERSDIYSLAATLYQLMTARPPVDALERSIEILEGKPDPLPSPAEINPEISGEVSAVLMKALEIRRENRFSSAAVMRRVLQTAFAQTKAPEVVKPIEADDDDMLEIAFAVQPPAIKNAPENAGQIELMKERLRKAEDQRILAEQRAAEAEKRLLEKEAEHPAQNPPPVEIALPAQGLSEAPARPVKNEMTKKVLLETSKPDELKDLFLEPKKENRFARRAALGLAIFVMLGGAGWGVWAFLQSRQTAENKTVFINEQKNSPVQATIPASQPTPEANPLVEVSPSSESVETLASSPAAKSNPAPQSSQTPVKKPAAAAKTPAPKKNVTVDDLINDN